jgi:hypothetical protein
MLEGRYLPRREASWELARSTLSMFRRAETRSTLDSGLASTLSVSERCGSCSGGSGMCLGGAIGLALVRCPPGDGLDRSGLIRDSCLFRCLRCFSFLWSTRIRPAVELRDPESDESDRLSGEWSLSLSSRRRREMECSAGFTFEGTSERACFGEGSALRCACLPVWEGSALFAGGELSGLMTAAGSDLS